MADPLTDARLYDGVRTKRVLAFLLDVVILAVLTFVVGVVVFFLGVVTLGLALVGLVLLAKVAAARLLANEGVAAHEFGQLQEIRDPPRVLESLVDHRLAGLDPKVGPELIAVPGDPARRLA